MNINTNTKNNSYLIISISIIYIIIAIFLGNIYSPLISFGLMFLFLFIVYYGLYIKNTFWHFLFIIPFIPPYLAYQLSSSLPVITAYRLILLLFIFDQLLVKKKLRIFLKTIKKDKFSPVIFIYSIGIMVPGFFHLSESFDKTAFIGSFSIIFENVILYYLILMNCGTYFKKDIKYFQKALSIICLSSLILSILGIIEYVTSFNIFHLLETSNVSGILSNTYVRQGQLRVSSSFSHALGYGLYLLLVIPIAFYKFKKSNHKKYYTVLLFLLIINLFLTISRSTLLAFGCSLFVFYLLSNLKRKIMYLYISLIIVFPAMAISLVPGTENVPVISIIGNNLKGLSDTFLGTHMATDYGNNIEPFSYRNQLINYALSQQGTDNIFGKGVGFIRKEPLVFYIPEINPYGPTISQSVDNYYANVKLESGWIGLISTFILLFAIILTIFRNRKKGLFNKIILVSFMGYLIELFSVNDLNTIIFLWILLAIYSSYLSLNRENKLLKTD